MVAHARRSLFIRLQWSQFPKKRKAARSVIGCFLYEVLDFSSVFGVNVPKCLFWDIRMYAFVLFVVILVLFRGFVNNFLSIYVIYCVSFHSTIEFDLSYSSMSYDAPLDPDSGSGFQFLRTDLI